MNGYTLEIITPLKSYKFSDVVHTLCPGESGYFGILKNHTNSIINLKEGVISVKTAKEKIDFSCSSGIVDINSDPADDIDDRVVVLLEDIQEVK